MTNWQKILIIPCALTALVLGGCSLSDEDVRRKAKEFTVSIDGCGQGSGAIYQKEGDIYWVLTAYHVVAVPGLSCRIFTQDGRNHEVDAPMIQPVPGVDLGILRFTSNNSYAVGRLGDSNKATEGKVVYVAGAPQASEGIPTRTVIVPGGTIVGRMSQPQDGYA